ncbi:MAG: OmpA family protein [Acidobacteria bacterium]|nr:OmpA family protein [Acidobacteriota bacterium]
MKNAKGYKMVLALLMGLVLSVLSMAQDKSTTTTTTTKDQAAQTADPAKQPAKEQVSRVETGKKQKVSGLIVRRDVDNMIVRDRNRTEYTINLTGTTKIEEAKKNPFRGAKQYETASLVRGLWVEVEGRGNDSGVLVAEKIKFTEEQFREATSLEARVDPVEDRVGDAETRLTQSEQNAQRLSGQLEELSAVANTARGGAKAAQETADKAITEVNAANTRITQTNERVSAVDERVSSLDNYEAKSTINIVFKVNSAVLSPDSKTALDELANQAKNEKGYVIQVAGFASADGNQEFNRRLSERRANAVMRYLIENHDISQRRIITPYGFGELKPAADNTTREGREQNRRVTVEILVSKGMATSTAGGKTE